ncbi:MAG: DNA helicase RecQ [Candidatus Cloacimonadaceae bacterium]|nr:DNA helicase RecQ [Candidatus Cloacimonadaceae bacterium]
MQITVTDLRARLSEVFGFDRFLQGQEEIILHLLEGKHALAVMPTGSGKSLCYQLPALIFANMSIVVSPMISLMKDQVMQMQALGIPTEMYNSSMNQNQQSEVLNKIKAGKVKLLYVAPETLLKEQFLKHLGDRRIDLVAIDEAHCISIWGHDFRPEYRQLKDILNRFPKAVCFALTATATPKVRKDICAVMDIPGEHQFIQSFNRKNLLLMVERKQDAFIKLLNFLKAHSGENGLIYCLTRKNVDTLTDKLQSEGFSVLPYHAGLSDEERNRNQEAFIRDEIRIIVATIAFGMGINKSNIRFVVHFDLPKNLETYYQEIGRSGRDGLPAVCMMMFGYNDLDIVKHIINLSPDPQMIKSQLLHLKPLIDYAETGICRRIPLLNWFGERFEDSDCGMCDNCLEKHKQRIDALMQAQKFLSTIFRSGQRHPAKHIIDILRGSKSKQITSFKHDALSVYGIGKEWKREQWFGLFYHLKKHGLIGIDPQYGSPILNDASWKIIRGETEVLIPASVTALLLQKTDLECDMELFGILAQKRLQLAREQGMPPYIIFNDRTLQEMASYFPHSTDSLRQIYGVGSKKLEDYGDIFLPLIKDYCALKNILETANPTAPFKAPPKISKSAQIADYLASGHSISQAMVFFDCKQENILKHLQLHLENGGSVDPAKLWEISLLEESDSHSIIEEFNRRGLGYLNPVYQALGEKYSYHELRILQLYLIAEKQAAQKKAETG